MVRRFPSIYAQGLEDGHFEVERRAAETLLEFRDCMAGEGSRSSPVYDALGEQCY